MHVITTKQSHSTSTNFMTGGFEQIAVKWSLTFKITFLTEIYARYSVFKSIGNNS